MSRMDWLRFALILATIGVLIGLAWTARGHVVEPTPSHAAVEFRSFDLPEPSPTPIVGLHEYGSPLAPAPTASPTPVQSARPKATSAAGHTASGSGTRTIRPRVISGALRGTATWYCKAGRSRCPTRYPDRSGVLDLYAAAGPSLRKALTRNFGSWRGRHVLVCAKLRCVEVKLVDWCACGGDHVIDLFWDAFHYLNPRATGGIHVAIDVR